MNNKPVTAIIVGAGHRAFVYSELAKVKPELLKIVGVADPNPVRRKKAMDYFGFSEDMCFETAEELSKKGRLADAIINEKDVGDIIEIAFGNKTVRAEVTMVAETTKKEDAKEMYNIL